MRDYGIPPSTWADGWTGCYGNEPTVEQYVAHTLEVFDALGHALRDDGVIWWNIGDCYNAGTNAPSQPSRTTDVAGHQNCDQVGRTRTKIRGMAVGNKALVPYRVAIGLQEAGWIIRQDPIWRKPSPMPESVDGWRWERCRVKVANAIPPTQDAAVQGLLEGRRTKTRDCVGGEWIGNAQWAPCPGCDKCRDSDGYILRRGAWRPTTAHEFVFQIVKSPEYFCDAIAAQEPTSGTAHGRGPKMNSPKEGAQAANGDGHGGWHRGTPDVMESRNPRSVWSISSEPLSLFVYDFQHADYVDDRGIPRKRSPDCPIHGQAAQPPQEGHAAGACDEQPTSNPSVRNGRKRVRRAQAPVDGSGPTENCKTPTDSDSQRSASPESTSGSKTVGAACEALPRMPESTDGTPEQSDPSKRDSLGRACSETATSHSSDGSKNVPDDRTSERDTASEETPCRTSSTTPESVCCEPSRNIDVNKTSMDGTSLSEQTVSGSGGIGVSCDHSKCTCTISRTSHFAAFPTMLAWKCIQASTSAAGCCAACGSQYAPVVEKGRVETRPALDSKVWKQDAATATDGQRSTASPNRDPYRHIAVKRTTGYRPTCGCNAGEPVPCVVGDPFTGSGTSLQVAINTGRRFVGSEIAEHYLPLIEERAAQPWQPKDQRKPAPKRQKRDKRELLLFAE